MNYTVLQYSYMPLRICILQGLLCPHFKMLECKMCVNIYHLSIQFRSSSASFERSSSMTSKYPSHPSGTLHQIQNTTKSKTLPGKISPKLGYNLNSSAKVECFGDTKR